MKNFKIFTVAMLFLAGATTLTSCGGEETKEEEKDTTEASADEQNDETSEDETISEEDDNEAGCVGDFFNLENDLTDKFIANIQSGAIEIGKTTKSEMETLTGSVDGFKKEYDGLRVSGYYSFEGDKLSSITLDYFYDCEGALSLLDMDKGDITSAINSTLAVEGVKDGDYENAGTTWDLGSQTLKQGNFSDGYSIYFDAK